MTKAIKAIMHNDPVTTAAERLLGRVLTATEIKRSERRADLQKAVREARQDLGLSQVQIAAHLGVSQSEVSRLESSIPGRLFERLLDYLDACGARLTTTIITASGRRLIVCPHELGNSDRSAEKGEIDELQKTLIQTIVKLDQAMATIGLDSPHANELRQEFMTRLAVSKRQET